MTAPNTDLPVVLGVAGEPEVVARSLSPQMYGAAFAAAGINGFYVPLGIRPGAARKALRSLPRLGFRGANVTMPFKALAAEIADSRSEAVEQMGVANTLVISSDGRIHAEATDGQAVVALAEQELSHGLQGKSVVLVGAGGAATECAFALGHAGASQISIWNRTPERAENLAERLRTVFPALGVEVRDELPIHVPADLLVSAVPEDAIPEQALFQLAAGKVIVDLAYRSDRQPTALVRTARKCAVAVVDGRQVLVGQGAASFRCWFAFEPPIEEMKRAVS